MYILCNDTLDLRLISGHLAHACIHAAIATTYSSDGWNEALQEGGLDTDIDH